MSPSHPERRKSTMKRRQTTFLVKAQRNYDTVQLRNILESHGYKIGIKLVLLLSLVLNFGWFKYFWWIVFVLELVLKTSTYEKYWASVSGCLEIVAIGLIASTNYLCYHLMLRSVIIVSEYGILCGRSTLVTNYAHFLLYSVDDPRLGSARQVSERLIRYLSSTIGVMVTVISLADIMVYDAAISISKVIVILCIEFSFSLVVSNVITCLALLPLDKSVSQIQTVARMLFDLSETSEIPENDILEMVIEKLTAMGETQIGRQKIQLKSLNTQDLGVLNLLNEAVRDEDSLSSRDEIEGQDERQETARKSIKTRIDVELLNSWNFDVLSLTKMETFEYLVFMFYVSDASAAIVPYVSMNVFVDFLQKVSNKYHGSNPYHKWEHAVDVTHCMYRFMSLTSAETYMRTIDRFSLLFASMGHDINHPGVNNIFLVERKDPLAVKYNDKSVLENMHCCEFFMITGDIFQNMSPEEYRESRRLIIESILATDNSHHSAMIRDTELFYQINEDIIDEQDLAMIDLYKKPENRVLLGKLLLHACDIANLCKPFEISRKWSLLVLEEFFLQGDKEKELNMQVQPLNDRDKVNIPMSQIGFIEFMVAPLYFNLICLFPDLHGSAEIMISNMKHWGNEHSDERIPDRVSKVLSKFTDRIYL
jgi:high affinity cGMP-specific 3',5'-cyclic phosphodiesterase 9